MKNDSRPHLHIDSLAELHKQLGFAKPKHPLFTVLQFKDFPIIELEDGVKLSADFYQITFKKGCCNKMIYGQSEFDFDEGVLSFFAPKQTFIKDGEVIPPAGFLIMIHPDYLKGTSLQAKIRSYSFFDYAVTESLILSEDEEAFIEQVFVQIEKEALRPIDKHSQDVIISSLELLLTYADRFYTRQFLTRKPKYNTLMAKFEKYLDDLVHSDAIPEHGTPNVAAIAEKFNLTPKYFSDLIRQHTGRSAQQHIHDKLIDAAKEKLSSTALSISEIAFLLGFEHPQSLSRLFKLKTNVTPSEYRATLN
ncbi:helix-turn-helix domain-containing protein [Flavobacterium sp. RHBU_24]|uniref:helix-turn-helix domain-containing protein n=1 Tax=Flavobacterium sp. RHBU_24 TaxID=3391185 RepID=UPI003984F014